MKSPHDTTLIIVVWNKRHIKRCKETFSPCLGESYNLNLARPRPLARSPERFAWSPGTQRRRAASRAARTNFPCSASVLIRGDGTPRPIGATPPPPPPPPPRVSLASRPLDWDPATRTRAGASLCLTHTHKFSRRFVVLQRCSLTQLDKSLEDILNA